MRGRILLLAVSLLVPFSQAEAEIVDTSAQAEGLEVRLVRSDVGATVIEYRLGSFARTPVEIGGSTYDLVSLEGESSIKALGFPELPNVARSVAIPDDAEMEVRVLEAHYVDIEGVRVAPSKGVLLRTVDPSAVPHTFDAFYGTDAWYPGELAYARDPYIMRDVRGAVVVANLFQYNPALETLRVYDRIVVEVAAVGPGRTNVLKRRPMRGVDSEFRPIYEQHFLNYDSTVTARYSPVGEVGSMLVICYDDPGFLLQFKFVKVLLWEL